MRPDDNQSGSTDFRPFFARTIAKDIETAFRLADLRPSERFLDLGCGDGRVLAEACHRGAISIGLELDPEMVMRARARLAGLEARSSVHEADFYSADLYEHEPDVVFAFLTHSSLQSLSSVLLRLPAGTRVVTVGTPIPGWVPTNSSGTVFLYRIPPEIWTGGNQPTWGCPGIAALLPTFKPTVTSFAAIHPPGPVAIRSSPEFVDILRIRIGRESLPTTGLLAIDLYWSPHPEGTFRGRLESEGLGPLPLAVIYSDEGPFGGVPFSFA